MDARGVALFAIPMAILTILGLVGDALAPTLLDDAPLLLIACNPRLRNLVAVSPTVDIVPFVAIAFVRLVISDPLFYFFGRRYGDVAIRWMERQLGRGAAPVLWLERMFGKAAYPIVAIIPNNWICLLAGATRMRWPVFAALNIGGTLVRIFGVRWLGDTFSDPILDFNAWVSRNQLRLTLLTIAIVGFVAWRSSRSGRDVLETPGELAAELAEAADAQPDTDAAAHDQEE